MRRLYPYDRRASLLTSRWPRLFAIGVVMLCPPLLSVAWSSPSTPPGKAGHRAQTGACKRPPTSGSDYKRWVRRLIRQRGKAGAMVRKTLQQAGRAAHRALFEAFATPSLRARKRLLSVLRPYTRGQATILADLIKQGKGAQRSGAMFASSQLRPDPSPALLRLLLWRLRRGPWYVRGAAAYALSLAHPTPVIQRALLRALQDPAWRVKGNAAAGLRRAGKRVHKALTKAQQHPHWTVRATAQALLRPPPTRALAKDQTQTSGQVLRILSYNICHGAGMDGSYSLHRIAKVIRQNRADIVGLQEVDQGTRRSLGHKQLKRLAGMLKMHGRFGAAISFQGGRFGNALLSRFPIVSHKIHTIPKLGGWEPRSILDVELIVPQSNGKPRRLRVFNTHLDNRSQRARMAAVARLQQLLGQSEQPALLIGDLNASPASPTLTALGSTWYNPLSQQPLLSMPATVPLFQIDYVLYRPKQAWQWQSATIDDTPLAHIASDHRPLLVQLRWPAPSRPRRP